MWYNAFDLQWFALNAPQLPQHQRILRGISVRVGDVVMCKSSKLSQQGGLGTLRVGARAVGRASHRCADGVFAIAQRLWKACGKTPACPLPCAAAKPGA